STLTGFQKLGERALSISKRRDQAPPVAPEMPPESRDDDVMEDVTMIKPQREQLGRNAIELRLPPRSGVELFASRALEDLAASVGYPHEAIGQMQSAVIEGVLNAVERSSNREKEIEVRLEARRDHFSITIENEGVPFDPQKVEKPSVEKKLHDPYKRGWGLALMERMMDRVVIEPLPHGTRLRLEKSAAPPQAESKNVEVEAEVRQSE
ncbi:MAG: ATP-binding protein, partial [Candidatus Sumerlaeota bacterium]